MLRLRHPQKIQHGRGNVDQFDLRPDCRRPPVEKDGIPLLGGMAGEISVASPVSGAENPAPLVPVREAEEQVGQGLLEVVRKEDEPRLRHQIEFPVGVILPFDVISAKIFVPQ